MGPTRDILPKLPTAPHGKDSTERARGSQEFCSGGAHLCEQSRAEISQSPEAGKDPSLERSRRCFHHPKLRILERWETVGMVSKGAQDELTAGKGGKTQTPQTFGLKKATWKFMESQKSAEHVGALSLHSQRQQGWWQGQQIPGMWGWRDGFPISAPAFPQNKDAETRDCCFQAPCVAPQTLRDAP